MSGEKLKAVFPVTTPHLVLRPFVAADARARFRLDSDPAIQRYLGEPTSQQRCEKTLMRDIEEFERQGYGALAVVEAGTGNIVGYAALQREPSRDRLELVIALEAGACGRGLGTEVAEALVLIACGHLRQPQVVGPVDPANAASLRFVAKLGMSRVEDRVDPLSGKTEHLYTLACDAWLKGRTAECT